jgi:hypothetical protein
MKLSENVLLLISQHPFLDQVDFCDPDAVTEIYEVFEYVFLNVAARNSITWKTLLYSNTNEPRMFAEFCVALILIDRFLNYRFGLLRADRYKLIGDQHTWILEDYYHNLQGF